MADARDSKSRVRKVVWVRLPPPAPTFNKPRTPDDERGVTPGTHATPANQRLPLCGGDPNLGVRGTMGGAAG